MLDLYKRVVKIKAIKNLLVFIGILLLNIILFTFTFHKFNLFYAFNDDIAMLKFANGEYTGTPTPYLVFILYPIGFILSNLYKVSREIPWYGLFQLAMIFLSLTLIMYKIVQSMKNTIAKVFSIFFYIVIYIIFIMPNVAMPQFTLTAAIICSALMIQVATLNNKSSKTGFALNLFICGLLSIFGISMRKDMFLLYLPMYIIILCTLVYNKEIVIKRCVVIFSIITLCSGGSYFIDKMMTNNYQGYKEFNDFNISRSEIFDYGDILCYSENKDFYSNLGITEAESNVISRYSFDLGPDLSNKTMKAIADRVIQVRKKVSFTDRFIKSYNFLRSVPTFSIYLMVVILSIILSSQYRKNKKSVFGAVGLLGYYNIIAMSYLLIKGRIVDRVIVSQNLSLIFFGLLCISLLLDSLNFKSYIIRIKNSNLIEKSLNIGIIIILLAFGLNGVSNYKLTQASIKSDQIGLIQQNTLVEYMKNNAKKYYIIDSCTCFADYVKVLQKTDTRINNFSSLGGWTCRSPQYYEKMRKYGINNAIDALCIKDNVYFVSNTYPDYLEKYIDEKYENKKIIEVDKLNTAGDCYHIYKVE